MDDNKKTKKSMFAIANDDLKEKQNTLDDLDVRDSVNLNMHSKPLNFRLHDVKS